MRAGGAARQVGERGGGAQVPERIPLPRPPQQRPPVGQCRNASRWHGHRLQTASSTSGASASCAGPGEASSKAENHHLAVGPRIQAGRLEVCSPCGSETAAVRGASSGFAIWASEGDASRWEGLEIARFGPASRNIEAGDIDG